MRSAVLGVIISSLVISSCTENDVQNIEVYNGISLGQTQSNVQDSMSIYGFMAEEFSTKRQFKNVDEILSTQIFGMVTEDLKTDEFMSNASHIALAYPNYYYDDFNLTRLVLIFGHRGKSWILDNAEWKELQGANGEYYYFDQSVSEALLESILKNLTRNYGSPELDKFQADDSYFQLENGGISIYSPGDTDEGLLIYRWEKELYRIELFSGIPNENVTYNHNNGFYSSDRHPAESSLSLNSELSQNGSNCRSYPFLRFELNEKGKTALGLE